MSSFYNELLAANSASGELSKTASVKDSATIRAELESANISGNQMEIIASEILSMFEKKAEAVIEDEVTDKPEEKAIENSENPAEAAIAADEELKGDATDAAIESAKASINDAASAIQTLESVQETSDAAQQVADVPVEGSTIPAAPAPTTPVPEAPAKEVVAAEGKEGVEKEAEEKDVEEKEEEKKESDVEEKEEETKEKESDDVKEDESDDEEKEVEAAAAEFERIMKEGSAEEKEELIKTAYDQALVKLANAGITLYNYVCSRVGGNEVLAAEITDKSEKLAALSEQNYLRVADDILYRMEKSASEL